LISDPALTTLEGLALALELVSKAS